MKPWLISFKPRWWVTFPSDVIKSAYLNVRKDMTKNLLQLLIILNVVMIIVTLILDAQSQKFVSVGIKAVGFVVCIIFWIFHEKLQKIMEVILGILFIGILLEAMLHVKENMNNYNVDTIFHIAFGFGILTKIFTGAMPRFRLHFSLSLVNIVVRVVILPCSRIEILILQIVIFFVEILIAVWREKVNRDLFKSYHNYREESVNFRNLLVSGLPVNISIFNRDLNQTLFSNECFKTTFHMPSAKSNQQHWDMTQWLNSLLVKKDALDFLPKSARYQNGSDNELISLFSILKIFTKLCLKDEENNHYCFTARKQSLIESRSKIYEVKVFSLLWNGEDAMAVVLNDVTQQYNNMALQVADANKDRMVAMVSHELRTPLNGILGMVTIMEKQITDPQVLQYLTVCKNSGKLLLSLVNSILDLGQIRNNKLKLAISTGELHDLLQEIYLLFEFQFKEKDLSLKMDVDSDINMSHIITTDINRLKQVLINLIGNALKFTFQGGVEVSVSSDEGREGHLLFKVKDTGVGIKEEDHKRLFQMYGRIDQTSQQNTQGVGLGLTISNLIVKLLSDSKEGIKVKSEHQKGTVFSFSIKADYDKDNIFEHDLREIEGQEHFNHSNEFPLERVMSNYVSNNHSFSWIDLKTKDYNKQMTSETDDLTKNKTKMFGPRRSTFFHTKTFFIQEELQEEQENDNHSDKKDDSSVSLEKERVLLVDDSPFNLIVARHILENLGYEVTTALNGKIAVEVVQKEKGFKVIFMDCQMPVMDGYEATQTLCRMMQKGEIPKTPIVALSANDTEKDKEKCREVGMTEHLSKPLEEKKLKEILAKVAK